MHSFLTMFLAHNFPSERTGVRWFSVRLFCSPPLSQQHNLRGLTRTPPLPSPTRLRFQPRGLKNNSLQRPMKTQSELSAYSPAVLWRRYLKNTNCAFLWNHHTFSGSTQTHTHKTLLASMALDLGALNGWLLTKGDENGRWTLLRVQPLMAWCGAVPQCRNASNESHRVLYNNQFHSWNAARARDMLNIYGEYVSVTGDWTKPPGKRFMFQFRQRRRAGGALSTPQPDKAPFFKCHENNQHNTPRLTPFFV